MEHVVSPATVAIVMLSDSVDDRLIVSELSEGTREPIPCRRERKKFESL